MTDSEDDVPQLSASTLAALQEYYTEFQERQDQLTKMMTKGRVNLEENDIDNLNLSEDWQLSQFWYDDETVDVIVRGALQGTEADGKIALISCPTLYKSLKRQAGGRTVTLFEYDTRFSMYGADFVSYDYKSPLNLPREMSSMYDLVIADPPFLSEECLTKTAVTMKFLTKRNIVLCTGAVMEELAGRLLDVHKCRFEPHHRNNLANEFYCYSNFDFDKSVQLH
ncbi:N(6)-adenine-specific DNA methyltransferase 2 [Fopius arisanus]|uniref:Protein-lysine N-methyltransferase LOC105272316 n=1 Tax=Fopius arisanus TaxID=64838 RepID=A0A9R1U8V4_9HYME|nr:PREDICTED: N(6)-adenine-specific DNA methyltransferase 2 [Fopius arisanus]